MPTAYIGLGSNLGDRIGHLRTAMRRIARGPVRVTGLSRIYETTHVGDCTDPIPAYLNAVARVDTELTPLALLHYTQSIERRGGRRRSTLWAPRTIDIDLLLYDDVAVRDSVLELPHPRMLERAFVLGPLAEIDPTVTLPGGGSVAARLQDPSVATQSVRPTDASW